MSGVSSKPMTTARLRCLWLLVCCAVAGAAQAGATVEVSATAEFNVRASKLQPGDELVLRDGVYSDARLELPCKGAEGKPIVVRPLFRIDRV